VTEVEIAWLAGLFEGEGHIGFTKKGKVKLVLAMTDFDVVTKAHTIAGAGWLGVRRQAQNKWKDCLVWTVSRKSESVPLLEAMLPHLGERRTARALEALERLAAVRGHGETHCPQGHEMLGDNLVLYTKLDGYVHRSCRECRKARSRNHYQNRKAIA
jgi:hypothetical protein